LFAVVLVLVVLGFAGHFVVGFLSAALLVMAGLLYVKSRTFKKIGAVQDEVVGLIKEADPFLYKSLVEHYDISSLKFSEMQNMVMDRLTSVRTMVSEVFLKQIRKLNYNLLFEDFFWANRRIGVVIGDLSKESVFEMGRTEISPSKELLDRCQEAQSMGTTLWFDDKEKEEAVLDDLIIAGQATTCFSLLKYISQIVVNPQFLDLPLEEKTRVRLLEKSCMDLFEALNADPDYLLEKLNQ
jgi:hypothetical protein